MNEGTQLISSKDDNSLFLAQVLPSVVLALLKKKKEKDVASQVPALLLLPMGTGYSYKGLEEKSFRMEDELNEWMLLMNHTGDKLSNMCLGRQPDTQNSGQKET